MVVHTNSARVNRARKTVAELMLSDTPTIASLAPSVATASSSDW